MKKKYKMTRVFNDKHSTPDSEIIELEDFEEVKEEKTLERLLYDYNKSCSNTQFYQNNCVLSIRGSEIARKRALEVFDNNLPNHIIVMTATDFTKYIKRIRKALENM